MNLRKLKQAPGNSFHANGYDFPGTLHVSICFSRALHGPEGISAAPALQTELPASSAAAHWQSNGEDYLPGFEYPMAGAALLCTDVVRSSTPAEVCRARDLLECYPYVAPCTGKLALAQREEC